MHNYVDRGIIKWAPFDALTGYSTLLKELRYKLGKKDQPILSDDQYETLNRKLQFAHHHQIELEIEYYHDGYVKASFGKIKKLDYIKGEIILTTFEKINALMVVDLLF